MMKHLISKFLFATLVAMVSVNTFAQNRIIGDKAFCEVFGNVKSINKGYQESYFDKQGKVEFRENAKYDSKGRLIAFVFDACEEGTDTYYDLKYDAQDRLISYATKKVNILDTDSSLTRTDRFYDDDGNCIQEVHKSYISAKNGGSMRMNSISISRYVILEKDHLGNWIKRKCLGWPYEHIEEREIIYY